MKLSELSATPSGSIAAPAPPSGGATTDRICRGRGGRRGRPDARRAARRLPADAPVASPRRQGDSAQEPEPDLLPGLGRRARGDPGRRRPPAAARRGLGLPLLSRPRLLPRAGRHALRDAAAGRRLEGRPRLGRPADAVALGQPPPEHRLGLEPDRHAVPARRRLRRSDDALRAPRRPAAARHPAARRRDHLRLDRRGRHQRRRVLGDAEHGVAGEAAARHPGRGQRLRDLGAGRRADAGRRRLAAAARLPRPADREGRRRATTSPATRRCGARSPTPAPGADRRWSTPR